MSGNGHGSGEETHQDLIDTIRSSPAEYVKVAITDVDGVLRGKYLDKGKFLSAARSGFGFCNVVFGWDTADECYDNATYTGWQSGYPDAEVRLDLSTHRRIPWEDDRHFFLGDFMGTGNQPLEVCPRRALRGVVERAAAMGYVANFGLEFEWFNFLESPHSVNEKGFRDLTPLTPGMFGYSVLRQAHNQPFFDALLRELRAFGVPLEGLHTETGPGVFEAAILYAPALEAADRAQLFKAGVKEIGHRFGIMPTFMARWNTDLPGCSGHAHQSLWDLDGEQNLFHDERDEYSMSALFRSYVAGILQLLPELLALWAPTVNSYKRLVDGFWAPTKPTWGIDNRTVACRVIPGSASSTRLEMRVPGADVNPYLAVAACLGAGLWGIEQGLELDQPPTRGSAYADGTLPRLPRTLQEATDRLAGSKVARELFGDGFVDHYVATREWEWRRFGDAVTDWELRRYFEII
ncbi:glutamine synthetase family protein [Rhabdothermincola sediminis]|uniref:glutamine synthetase family protein n=1 Tax=Rhabdothermincola sediminis TaxID=2751370 RepID=UPI001AA083E2|nr:glutamine synthetase family protein [Rhabdothermincola sediminis]